MDILYYGQPIEEGLKQKSLDFHPVKTLVAILDDRNNIVVMDYLQRTIMHKSGFLRSVIRAEKTGNARSIRFLDTDVIWWQKRKDVVDAGKPKSLDNLVLVPSTWLVILCDHRVVFFDFMSSRRRDMTPVDLENKNATCMCFGPDVPFVFVGCSDGAVRVWNVETWSVELVLMPKQPKPITSITSYYVMGSVKVVAGTSDGSLVMWQVLRNHGMRHQPSFVKERAHESNNVTGLCLVFSESLIYSAGNDRTIAAWDMFSLQERKRISVRSKDVRLIPFGHPDVETSYVLATIGDSKIMAVSPLVPNSATMNEIADIRTSFGDRNKHKLVDLACHPLQPNLIAASLTENIGIFSLNRFSIPNAAFTFTKGLSEETGDEGAASFRLLRVYQTKLEEFNSNKEGATTPEERFEPKIPMKLVLAGMGSAAIDISFSPTGKFLLAFARVSREYLLYKADSFSIVDSGKCESFAWSTVTDQLAMVTKSKVGEQVVSILSVKDLSAGDAIQEQKPVLQIKNPITRVLGGGLIGVVFQGSPEGDARKELFRRGYLQFLSWDSFQPIGAPLPPPRSIHWSPSRKYCILTYKANCFIFIVKPEFRVLRSFAFTVQSILWHYDQLFIATPSSIFLLTPAADQTDQELWPITIADLLPPSSADNENDEYVADRTPFQRPAGPIRLVAIVDQSLLVADARHQIHGIPLDHPSIQFRLAANAAAAIKDWNPSGAEHAFCAARAWLARVFPPARASLLAQQQSAIAIDAVAGAGLVDERSLFQHYLNLQDWDAARNALKDEENATEAATSHRLIASEAEKAGNTDEAKRCLEIALALDEEGTVQPLAALYTKLGDRDALRQLHSRCSTSMPEIALQIAVLDSVLCGKDELPLLLLQHLEQDGRFAEAALLSQRYSHTEAGKSKMEEMMEKWQNSLHDAKIEPVA